MEKIYICSDVHGDYEAFKAFVDKAKKNPIIICGDLVPRSQSFSSLFATLYNDLYIVKGNCDNAYDFALASIYIPPRIRHEKLLNKDMVITHGDMVPTPFFSPIMLNKGDFFIFGHTHVPKLFIDDSGVINLNPGSLSLPRGKYDSSYAIIYDNLVEIRTLKKDKVIFKLKI